MKFITFQLKNGNLKISENDLELVILDDWYLSLLIKHEFSNLDEETSIAIDEEYEIFKDIIDSFKFRTFIISDMKKINYISELAKKWCFPDWLLELIEQKVIENSSFQMLKKMTLEYQKCVNCGVTFKESENHANACSFHPGKLEFTGFKCCGYIPRDNNFEIKYCCVGYHGVNKNEYCYMFEKNHQILQKYQDKYKS